MRAAVLRRADPLDLAVARAFQRSASVDGPALPPMICAHQVAKKMVAETLGVGTFDPLTVDIAEVIFGFDQEAIEQPWHRLSEHRRQPYYDIAEAVLERLNKRGVV